MLKEIEEIKEKCRQYSLHPDVSTVLDNLDALFTELSKSRGASTSDAKYQQIPGNEPKKGYVICITPRSGSTLLSAALAEQTHRGYFGLGYPGEIFNFGHVKQAAIRYGCRSLDEYVKCSLKESTDPSGAFGVKGDLFQLLPFLLTPTFQHLLPTTRFIYLTREDILLQAISLAIAEHTGKWTSDCMITGEYQGDFDEISANVDVILQMMASFEKIFAFSNIVPCRIFTSEIENDLACTMKKVIKFVEAPIDADQMQISIKTSRTRDRLNESLKQATIAKLSLATSISVGKAQR